MLGKAIILENMKYKLKTGILAIARLYIYYSLTSVIKMLNFSFDSYLLKNVAETLRFPPLNSVSKFA